jgi:hypothetical protein
MLIMETATVTVSSGAMAAEGEIILWVFMEDNTGHPIPIKVRHAQENRVRNRLLGI